MASPNQFQSHRAERGKPGAGAVASQVLVKVKKAEAVEAVAVSRSAREALASARQFGSSKAPVLITGESGTGKEVIAKTIHEASPRAHLPYVCVNCAALSESLIESELFGHERGAFTGATERRIGRIEWARGGTLLLDEISEISPRVQAKLLRVLEEMEYQCVGGNETYPVEARILATSNRRLEQEVAEGRFRADLFYRLDVLRIHVSPLRERREDIPPLVKVFVDRFRKDEGSIATGVTEHAARDLVARPWPGNVRQLRNVVRAACIVASGNLIQSDDLPTPNDTEPSMPDHFAEMRLADIERNVILANLTRFQGNKTATARHLGVSSRTLFNKIRQYEQNGTMTRH